jgi:serine/threonine protein kinase
MVEMLQVKCAGHEAREAQADAMLPALTRLGDFRILREVGRGGMGVVVEAEQVSLGRRVALKVLPEKRLTDARARQRFEREARAAAKLHHTNIVPVFGFGEHEGVPYYVMQYIPGLGLDKVLEELRGLQPSDKIGNQLRISPRETMSAEGASEVARSLLTGQFALRPEVGAAAQAPSLEATVDHVPTPASQGWRGRAAR